MRGHLLALNTMIPLSIEKLSEGNPLRFQCLIVTGSPSIYCNENIFEAFNLALFNSYYQFLIVEFLYIPVKAPRYDIIAEANRMSPVKFLYYFES
jgi:hypothetical protein